jgi:putative zinc finger/helix-turn-helix YgiT family protein
MSHIVTTSQCYECGRNMEGRVEDYKYLESGLRSVVLHNILVFRCAHCGAEVPQIVAASELHRRIAMLLLAKETRLTGEEFRFLRKVAGYSATELAEQLATSKAVVSRWETKSAFGKEAEQVFRMLCVLRLTVEIVKELGPDDSEKAHACASRLRTIAEHAIASLKGIKVADTKKRPTPLKIQIDTEEVDPGIMDPKSLTNACSIQ